MPERYAGKAVLSPADVVEAARGWVGTRFHHQGRLKASEGRKGGCDCLGLLVGVARELRLPASGGGMLADFDERDYGHMPDGRKLKATLDLLLEPIAPQDAGEGDVLLLRIEGVPQHLAIVCGYPYGGLGMIHALAANRRVVEHRLDEAWRGRIAAAYRIPLQAAD